MRNIARSASRVALASLVAVVVGCSASDDSQSIPSEDQVTADEQAAGQQWAGEEDESSAAQTDPVDPGASAATEDSATPPDTVTAPDTTAPPSDQIEEPQACNAATGYKSGKAFRICVTTIDGKPVEVSTASALLRMRAAAQRAGVSIRVVSGFRTMAEQRHLYALYKAGRGNLAAPPGYSNHQSGHALDLNTSASGVYSWLSRHGSAYGFRRTVPSEKWHWEHW